VVTSGVDPEDYRKLSARERQAEMLAYIWQHHGASVHGASKYGFVARALLRHGWVSVEGSWSECGMIELRLTPLGEAECRNRFGPQPKKRRTWQRRNAARSS
jgi:hypothetical protein